ncbi:MAG TPA: hypothetical protein VJU87_00105 [Gemmatimonadaceae bacterium]|nr:hypothetical protein [Gemmatimonadaceae bacterium]
MSKTDLAYVVEAQLLGAPGVPAIELVRVVGQTGAEHVVDLRYDDVVLRLRREKRWYEVLFTSVVDTEWFGSAEILEFFRLPDEEIDSQDATRSVLNLRAFLERFGSELSHVFAKNTYARSKPELLRARMRRNLRRWPSNHQPEPEDEL